MKRTLLITLDYPPMIGGVAHYYKNLVQHLPHDRVWVLDNAQHELLSRHGWMWPKWIIGVWNSYRAVQRYHIEHILVGQVLPVGTIALILKWVLRVPYTVMTHAMDVTFPFGPRGSSWKRKLVRLILRSAHSITTVSIYTRLYLELIGVQPGRVTMVYPCPNVSGLNSQYAQVDTTTLDNRYGITGKRIMLSVCRLIERKGIDMALQAFARVAKQFPDVQYVIVNDGPDRMRLEGIVQQHHIADRVLFVGAINDAELAAWYARCTFFILPARQLPNHDVEGFGIVFVEANSFGKPVIGGKSGGISDAVVDGETGFLVEPTDVTMITRAIERLLTDTQTATRLGENGRKRVQEFFQWHIQARALERLLS